MKKRKITFRVSDEEYDEIQKKSEKFHFSSVSEFCRMSAFASNDFKMFSTPKVKEQITWTEERKSEFVTCKNDIIYFADRFCNLNIRSYQKPLLTTMEKNGTILLSGPRRCGITTMGCVKIVHHALFSENKQTIVIKSHSSYNSKSILENIKSLYHKLPIYLKKGISNSLTNELIFDDGTGITITNNSMRGLSIDLLFWDNCGHDGNFEDEEFIVNYSLNQNSKLILSCSGERRGLMKLKWDRPTESTHKCFIEWRDVYPSDFKETTIKLIGENSWKKEYEFSTSN